MAYYKVSIRYMQQGNLLTGNINKVYIFYSEGEEEPSAQKIESYSKKHIDPPPSASLTRWREESQKPNI